MVEGYYAKDSPVIETIKWLEGPEDTDMEKGEEIIATYHSEHTWKGPSIMIWKENFGFGSLFVTNRRLIFCAVKEKYHSFKFNLDKIGKLDDEWKIGNLKFEFKKGSSFLGNYDSVLISNTKRLKMLSKGTTQPSSSAREFVNYMNGPFVKERKKSIEKKAKELLNQYDDDGFQIPPDTESLLGAATNYKILGMKKKFDECLTKLALKCEKLQDFDGAINYYKIINSEEDIIRLRKQKSNKVKVDQTVVHGDYIDDRDTIVKDSVISKSNIGAGGKTKGERIKLIKELLDSGAIDDDEFKQMKKEILGK